MTFDTLDFSRRLKNAGFTEQQAETLAEATRDHVTGEMVTKSFLQAELQKLDQKLEMEVERLRLQMDKLSMQLTVRTGIMLAAGLTLVTALLGALIKFH